MARVMIMAGGTGGHVFPALAVARELRERGWDVDWMGTPDSFEARTVPPEGFPLHTISAYRLRGQGLGGLMLAPFRLLRAMGQAGRVLRHSRPQVVLGMGGFVTGPGGLMSRVLGIPLVIHEQNTIPGLTNRWLAKIAARVLEAFPGSFPASVGATETGNPVRADILAVAPPEQRLAGRKDPLRILVIGGSLGAVALNEEIPPALARLEQPMEIRHQAGRGKAGAASDLYAGLALKAQVSEFIDDMAGALAWADLVICRAGALTISELAAVGVASVLVPFPHAVDDHQTRNARYLVEAGAALLQPQSSIDTQALVQKLAGLLENRKLLLEMAMAARALGRPRATQQVADECAAQVKT
ncbi:undecaprenyldiphospho-muramoylpentapeptide beta-N-acetylglucosaminyltransferase [Thiolapillus brandeum]|uniref:UDP-N-acetylglucosamine--N-acetylmuramyl-(pentapeptide) pyrophosphoryl-undecaprenol N-acetylglucosamine transferase n=1 Tax=Thiolapillus brandeum TaxID=1076588 RepID=A0A7U6GH06_9GAMM|nr:undecaprenyldiphospho-muramoylpentapeptide beta-N-acetylglucosaminyltransferase [Thiolapillus brandeum]BAO43503.1 UDP-N-acetylglucosamine--N-acetylmuramyl-(pentapeptide) pyrophosphoryl-undecaprenol N-acetylglucosamine transferase [Thiolapillus brandeum]